MIDYIHFFIILPVLFCKMARFLFMSETKWLSILLNLVFLLLLVFCFFSQFPSSNSTISNNLRQLNLNQSIYKTMDDDVGCKRLQEYLVKKEKCYYVKSHKGCQQRGYIPYLQIFYCKFSPGLGYTSLPLWLVILFYLLGDTASNYFCSSLEGLSEVLKLTPTVAGVTLLSLGNGAPDVVASIISFSSQGTKDIGLNSILGGAFFVSSLVVGIISISVSKHGRKISRSSFIINVVFLLFCLSCLLGILAVGKINLWGALSFLSLYMLYAIVVFMCTEEEGLDECPSVLLPLTTINIPKANPNGSSDSNVPLLLSMANERHILTDQKGKTLWYILELPLYLPRRLTIPLVSQEKWSKPFAVVSIALDPLLFALIWGFNTENPQILMYAIVGSSIGIALGILAFCTTARLSPPRKCLFLWLALGFLMSIIWTYILAQELISLLVSIGLILGINHSILGLTVMAWGNSLGDLVSNTSLAKQGGPRGAQLAISGCYAGPIFNTLVGLGLSLTFSTWAIYPGSCAIQAEDSVFETIGFLIMGLLWALVTLLNRKMRLDRIVGSGLLAIYACFLSTNIARTLSLL